MYLDECPKLARQILQTSGALGPGVKTHWAWPGIADAPTIEITGGVGAFTIDGRHSTVSPVRVVVTKRGMECPRCGAGCYQLVFRDGWGCVRCSGLRYRSECHPPLLATRPSLLRQLVRADPLSLRAYELERKLHRVNRALSRRAKSVEQRITSGRSGG